MIYLIIRWTLISLILIALIHYLYIYFKNTLTIPKVKDLVNRPTNAYKEIYEIIENNSDKYKNNISLKTNGMKDELKTYLSNLNKDKENNPNKDIKNENNIDAFEFNKPLNSNNYFNIT